MKSDTRRKATLIATIILLSSIHSINAQWTNGTPNINNTNTGNVGVGTTNPAVKLDVGGWTGMPSDVVGAMMHVGNPAGGDVFLGNSGTNIGRLRLGSNANGGFLEWNLYYNGASIKSLDTTKPGYSMDFAAAPGFDGVKITRYSGSPLVPTTLLTVDSGGNVTASGSIQANYQDVAEWVPTDGDLSPGTVVVVDSTKTNSVEPSSQAYDVRVAGVVSERPGVLLGARTDHSARIATTGRVKVRVDATTHPIAVGDILVTSATPGMAMVSKPLLLDGIQLHRPGTILGKALEPLATGRGEILVLLSLQ